MKKFFSSLLKLIIVILLVSWCLYISWNEIIYQELGIGKEVRNLYPFYLLTCLWISLSFIRLDTNFLEYVRYLVTWKTITLSAVFMFICYLIL